MTAPIRFPDIPSQMPIRAPRDDSANDLAQLLITIAQGRKQLAHKGEELKLQREEFEQRKSEAGARTEGTRLDNEKKKRELEIADLRQQAEELVADALPGLLTNPEGRTPKAISELRVRLIQGNKKIAPYVDEAFTAVLKDTETLEGLIAQRRQGVANAQKAEATAPLAEKREKAEIDNFARMTAASQAAITKSAFDAWQNSTQPWGVVRKEFGLPKGEMDDNAVFVDPAKAGQGGATREQAARAAPLATQMRISGALIDVLEGKRGLGLLGSVKRSMKAGLTSTLANKALSPEQRQLVQSTAAFSDAYRFYISGQQSADVEALRMMNTVVPEYGDDADTRRQKRLLRAVQTSAVEEVAAGAISPLDAAERILIEATNLDMPAPVLAVLRAQRNDAARRGDARTARTRAGTEANAPAPRATPEAQIGKYFSVPR